MPSNVLSCDAQDCNASKKIGIVLSNSLRITPTHCAFSSLLCAQENVKFRGNFSVRESAKAGSAVVRTAKGRRAGTGSSASSHTRSLLRFRTACRLFPFRFQAALYPFLRLIDVLFPGRRIDEGVGFAGLAGEELREALEERAVGIIGARVPAMVRQIHINALYRGDASRALHRLLEPFHAVAPAQPAGIERLMRRAIVIDGEFKQNHARRVTRRLIKVERRVAQGARVAGLPVASARGRPRRR